MSLGKSSVGAAEYGRWTKASGEVQSEEGDDLSDRKRDPGEPSRALVSAARSSSWGRRTREVADTATLR